MQAHSRFQRRSLRDVLVAQGVLTSEIADELMTSSRDSNEPFGVVVVDSGYLTAWDLAKVVSTQFQMPALPLGGFVYDRELADGISPAVLYQYQMVPVGRFGDAWSFAVVEPPTRDCLEALREVCGNKIFFFVAEVHEVQKILRDNVKVVDVASDKAWESIFDVADQTILERTPESNE
ncbi:MAG: GspE/PulE/PilB domain-containing protein [Planctomycetota bacterium]|jgi:hypothetical protein